MVSQIERDIYKKIAHEEKIKKFDRLEKLEKVIEILKRDFNINFLGENPFGFKPYEIMFRSYVKGFDKEEYELLKEVFSE